MKRLLIGIMIAVLAAGAFLGLLYLTGGEALRSFLKEKVWSALALVLGSSSGTYLLISPVIKCLNNSSGRMGAAAADFEQAKAALAAANEEKEAYRSRVDDLEAQLAEQRRLLGKFCRVFAIGWGADERMVKSGATREMVKLVEEYEKKNA